MISSIFREIYHRFFQAIKNDINFDNNIEVKKCKTIDDLLGKSELVQKIVKDVLENIFEAEMDEHLGIDKYQYQNQILPEERNYRNGYRFLVFLHNKKYYWKSKFPAIFKI